MPRKQTNPITDAILSHGLKVLKQRTDAEIADAVREPERRKLTMHDDLLKSIVFQQAGTREKAVLEGVMNSVDAEATQITIQVTKTHLIIADNGTGFPTRDKILAHFEMFGTPHQEGDATYGRYRMGRGQLFAFGKNVWRTATFQMEVDAKKELAYDLHENLPRVVGCTVTVEWYDELSNYTQDVLEREIKKFVKYVNVPVTLNDEVISLDPAKQTWDVETDQYYIKFKDTGSLHVYNLGVFVMEVPAHRWGSAGTVVSKQRLDVNFARNDVKENCPIWKRIAKDLRGVAERKVDRAKPLTDDERFYYATQLRHGELTGAQATKLKLFTDVVGRHWSASEILSYQRKHGITSLTVAERNDAKGDKLMQQNTAFVLSRETLERFSASSLDDLMSTLQMSRVSLGDLKAEPFHRLASHLLGDYVLIPKTKWTPTERAVLRNLTEPSWAYARMVSKLYPGQSRYVYDYNYDAQRTLQLGESDVASAWTDGSSYITITRSFLRRAGTDAAGWYKIALMMLHEYCHDDPTTESHTHTPEFYQRYHDAHDAVAEYAAALVKAWPETLKKEGRKIGTRVHRMTDRMNAGDEQLWRFEEMVQLQDKFVELQGTFNATAKRMEQDRR